MRNSSPDLSFAAKTLRIFGSLLFLFLFLHLNNVEGIQIAEKRNIHEHGEGMDDVVEFEVHYSLPTTHPPENYPDGEDEIYVDYSPPKTHPPKSPPTYARTDPPTQPPTLKGDSHGKDEFGADYSLPTTHPPENYPDGEDEIYVDYSPPKTHPPKSPPTYAQIPII